MAGRPLVSHTVEQALAAEAVRAVVVSTDDEDIAATAALGGAEVVRRPPALATVEATTESALLHVLDQREDSPDLVVLLQPTCPLRPAGAIDAAIATLMAEGADTLFSACREVDFRWTVDDDGARSVSYDWRNRQRTQDMTPTWRENGSIYVTRTQVLRDTGNRLGGRIAVYEMDRWSSVDVDDHDDLELVDWIMRRRAAEEPA